MTEYRIRELPQGWMHATLGEICEKPQYGWTTRASDNQENLKFLRTTDISRGEIDWSSVPHCAEDPPNARQYLICPGDIVISRAGSIGLSSLISDCPAAVFASYLIRFRPSSEIDRRYISYFLKSSEYWDQIAASAAGIALQNVNARKLAAIGLPLAPLAEQHRIVAAIEEQFTRLDAAVAGLKRTQANLKRYRAAVLAAACSGRLVPTEAELAACDGRAYEPADQLLQRILQERRERWEADQLAKMQAQGKAPKDDAWKGKYKEPSESDTASKPSIPDGWDWAVIEQIGLVQGGIQKQLKRQPKSNCYPFLRVANVLRGRLDLDEIHEVELFDGELEKLRLESDDLLIVEGNGSPTQIGRMAIWDGSIDNCVHQNHIIRVRPLPGVLAKYVESYWNSPLGSHAVASVASSTSGLYTLSVSKINRLSVPVPPEDEQRRIITEVDRRMSVIDELEKVTENALKRANRLRQSILRRAFEGNLVSQDPTDEPTELLLERVKAERAQMQANGSNRRSKPGKSKEQQRLFDLNEVGENS